MITTIIMTLCLAFCAQTITGTADDLRVSVQCRSGEGVAVTKDGEFLCSLSTGDSVTCYECNSKDFFGKSDVYVVPKHIRVTHPVEGDIECEFNEKLYQSSCCITQKRLIDLQKLTFNEQLTDKEYELALKCVRKEETGCPKCMDDMTPLADTNKSLMYSLSFSERIQELVKSGTTDTMNTLFRDYGFDSIFALHKTMAETELASTENDQVVEMLQENINMIGKIIYIRAGHFHQQKLGVIVRRSQHSRDTFVVKVLDTRVGSVETSVGLKYMVPPDATEQEFQSSNQEVFQCTKPLHYQKLRKTLEELTGVFSKLHYVSEENRTWLNSKMSKRAITKRDLNDVILRFRLKQAELPRRN